MRAYPLITLDGIDPEALDPDIRVTDVTEDPPDLLPRTASLPGGCGTLLLGCRRTALTVRATFVISAAEPDRRASLLDRLRRWAQGGILRVGHRPGQRLQVSVAEYPAPGSLFRWEQPVRVSLSAWEKPFFEEETPVRSVMTDGRCLIRPGGTMDLCPLNVSVTNTGAAPLTRLTLRAAETGTFFALNDLLVPPGETLTITEDVRLRIRCGETSFLGKRTAASSDSLTVRCGADNTITAEADAPFRCECTARGRFL